MAVDFTVAIPTYNGATRLPQVLDRLRSQVNTESIGWEILVVDNNSQDETAAVVRAYQADWPAEFPLRYCFEETQGLAFARQRAIAETDGTFIAFLDDDNLPAPDWVSAAYQFGCAHPQVGAYGGQIHPAYEVPPPDNFKRLESFLAVREQGNQPWRYQPETLHLPPGAALVVRRQAWCEAAPPEPTLKGRVNGSMLAGEDYEILLHMHKANWEIWYNPTMHTYHQIPPWRLEREYLVPLIRGASLCIFQLRMINAQPWQRPIIVLRIILGNLRRILQHLIQYRQGVKTDLIAACELEFFLFSLYSPFFFLKQQFSIKSS